MWTIHEVKEKAKKALRLNYWKCFFSTMIYLVVTGGTTFSVISQSVNKLPTTLRSIYENEILKKGEYDWRMITILIMLGLSSFIIYVLIRCIIAFLLKNPIYVGFSVFLNKTAKAGELGNDEYGTGMITDNLWAFDHNYKNIVKVMFVRSIITAVGYILFIIPGAVLFYRYCMVPFLLADNPDLTVKEALQTSTEMMKGNKWNTFVLDLSFILWHLLGFVTFGVAEVFYVEPYENLSYACLYKTLKEQNYGKEM